MKKCIVCGKEEGRLFAFPSDSVRRLEWADAVDVRLEALQSFDRICHLHFHRKSFKNDSRQRLKSDACPTLQM